MNQRMYNKITSLYNEGIASNIIAKMIIDLSKNTTEAAEKVDMFYQNSIISQLKKEEYYDPTN